MPFYGHVNKFLPMTTRMLLCRGKSKSHGEEKLGNAGIYLIDVIAQ